MSTSQAVEKTQTALKNAGSLSEFFRSRESTVPASEEQIRGQFRLMIDRLMSEAGLYCESWAALAIKQSEGRQDEAITLLRARAGALSRAYQSDVIDTERMYVERRISSSFREIPGGQVLGATRDYTQRLLDEVLGHEDSDSANQLKEELSLELTYQKEGNPRSFTRVTDLLRSDGLMFAPEVGDDTRARNHHSEPMSFPHHRSESLSALSRSETGMTMALGYASQRGFGGGHGTIGELRVGRVDVKVTDKRGRKRSIGNLRVTECEMVGKFTPKKVGALPSYSVGYGLSFGQNETKAICMGKLESSLREPNNLIPASSPEYVLSHLDGATNAQAMRNLATPQEAAFSSDQNVRLQIFKSFNDYLKSKQSQNAEA